MSVAFSQPNFLWRFIARHLIGLFAASQTSIAVAFHAGWVFLLMIALLIPQDQPGLESIGKLMLRGLQWIGAIEKTATGGHGDLGTVMGALAKVTPVVYVLQLLLALVRGERKPWSILRKTLVWTLIAAVGYTTAIALLPDTEGLVILWVIFMTLTTFATLWAACVQAFCRWWLRMFEGGSSNSRAR